jgi:hypothetical protein
MTVAWLAIRELWISYRLMLVVGAFVAAGAVVALLPAIGGAAIANRLAIGYAVATGIAAMMSAWSLAIERRQGRVAWLVGRGVPRASIVMSWFGAIGLAALLGLVPSAALVWAVIAPLAPALGLVYAAAILAVAASVLAAVALGQLSGAVLPPIAAAAAAFVTSGAAIAASWLVPDPPSMLPGAGYVLLAQLGDTTAPIGRALAGAGAALGTAAALLVLTAASFERVDL